MNTLDNTLEAWKLAVMSERDVPLTWKKTQEVLVRKKMEGILDFDTFQSLVIQHEDDILKTHYVIGLLNVLTNNTTVIEHNIDMVLEKGYTYNEKTTNYEKKVRDVVVKVNQYMIDTHKTLLLQEIIKGLEQNA